MSRLRCIDGEREAKSPGRPRRSAACQAVERGQVPFLPELQSLPDHGRKDRDRAAGHRAVQEARHGRRRTARFDDLLAIARQRRPGKEEERAGAVMLLASLSAFTAIEPVSLAFLGWERLDGNRRETVTALAKCLLDGLVAR